MGLLTLLSIVGFATFLAAKLEVRFSVAMLHAVSAVILVLYLGAFLHVLWWTALALHLVGIVLGGVELSKLGRSSKLPNLSPPLLVLAACVAFFWVVHGTSTYLYYDEYAHWGIYLKEMLALDGFWLADTNSMHPRYPPAAPLWQYLFNVFGEPSEGKAYLAQFVLLITPLLVLWERITLRGAAWLLLILALCTLALTNFGLGISSLYVDHVIGAWFIGIVLCFILESPTLRRSAMYALPLATLALLKESSVAFSFAAAGILGLLVWIQAMQRGAHFITSAGRAGFIVVVLLPAVLLLQAWEWRLDRIGAPSEHEAVGGIVSGLSGGLEQVSADQGAEITRRFLEVFSNQQISNDGVSRQFNSFSYPIRDLFTDRYRLSTLGLFVAFAIWWVGLTVFILRGAERWTWGTVAVGMVISAAGYLGALYLTYRFSAGEQGLVLSSYTRYVQTIALPMLIASFAPLLPAFRRENPVQDWQLAGRAMPRHAILAAAGCIGLYAFEPPYLRPIFEKNPVLQLRQELEPVTEAVQFVVGRSSVWLYMPNDANGFIGHLFQFLMAPTPTSVAQEAAFLERDAKEVVDEWSKFDYVWLPTDVEPEVARRFTEATGLPLTQRLFLVSTDDSGKTSLTPATAQM